MFLLLLLREIILSRTTATIDRKHLAQGQRRMRQQADWPTMIWNVPDTNRVSSEYYVLKPGDLIFTGTPAGVGAVKRGDQMVGAWKAWGKLVVTVV